MTLATFIFFLVPTCTQAGWPSSFPPTSQVCIFLPDLVHDLLSVWKALPQNFKSLTPSHHSDHAQMLFPQKCLAFLAPPPITPFTSAPVINPITLWTGQGWPGYAADKKQPSKARGLSHPRVSSCSRSYPSQAVGGLCSLLSHSRNQAGRLSTI